MRLGGVGVEAASKPEPGRVSSVMVGSSVGGTQGVGIAVNSVGALVGWIVGT